VHLVGFIIRMFSVVCLLCTAVVEGIFFTEHEACLNVYYVGVYRVS